MCLHKPETSFATRKLGSYQDILVESREAVGSVWARRCLCAALRPGWHVGAPTCVCAKRKVGRESFMTLCPRHRQGRVDRKTSGDGWGIRGGGSKPCGWCHSCGPVPWTLAPAHRMCATKTEPDGAGGPGYCAVTTGLSLGTGLQEEVGSWGWAVPGTPELSARELKSVL